MSCLGKIFCILINTRLYARVEKINSKWQGSFRRKTGCDIQCFRLLSSIMHQFSKPKGYNNKNQVEFFAVLLTSRKCMILLNMHFYGRN